MVLFAGGRSVGEDVEQCCVTVWARWPYVPVANHVSSLETPEVPYMINHSKMTYYSRNS